MIDRASSHEAFLPFHHSPSDSRWTETSTFEMNWVLAAVPRIVIGPSTATTSPSVGDAIVTVGLWKTKAGFGVAVS